jgi:hypothetical protein
VINPDLLVEFQAERDLALRLSVRLNEYLAHRRLRVTPPRHARQAP